MTVPTHFKWLFQYNIKYGYIKMHFLQMPYEAWLNDTHQTRLVPQIIGIITIFKQRVMVKFE